MKKYIQPCILAIEALLCVLIAVNPQPAMASFPFAQIGDGLRTLSLSSAAGNGCALALYIMLCLLPCAFLFVPKKRKLRWEDVLLPALSALLFYVLYLMINPGAIPLSGGFAAGSEVSRAVLCGAVYATLIGYLVLRAMRFVCGRESSKTMRDLSVLLFLVNMIFIAAIFGVCLRDAVRAIQEMQISNSANAHLFDVNSFFIVLTFLVSALPYALNIAVVCVGQSLLRHFTDDRYSDATLFCAKRLMRLCVGSIVAIVCVNILFNVLQIAVAPLLFSVHVTVQIPLFAIAFVLACLLFTRLITEGKALKADNDSII